MNDKVKVKMIEVSVKPLGWDTPAGVVEEQGQGRHTKSSIKTGDIRPTTITHEHSHTTRLAQQALRMLQMLGLHGDTGNTSNSRASGEHAPPAVRAATAETGAAPRVLVLEPRSDVLCHALRRAGFTGELWALLRRPIAYPSTASQLRGAYDSIAYWDWSEPVARLSHAADSVAASTAMSTAKAPARLGAFSAVVVSDASRLVSADQLSFLLSALGSLVQERGYLFVSEPYPDVDISLLEHQLLRSGLLLASDPEQIGDDWPRTLATFQKRGGEEAHLIGSLQRVEWPAVEASVSVQDGIVATYREVFGGDEWHEWVRCTRPGANHHYSQREAALLSPPNQCICGWPRPLQSFHTHETVLEKLHHDLARQPVSCCYLKINQEDAVEGFTWGYLAEADDVAHMLAAGQGGRVCDCLRERIGSLVTDVDGDHSHTAVPSSPATRVFYHSELGVRNSVRSLSLARGLFHRAFQFAYDHGASIVVLRTSMTSPAYDISKGLGMRTLYRYTDASAMSAAELQFSSSADPRHTRHRKAQRSLSSVLEQQADTRVVVGGDLKRMLQFLGGESDRRLVMRMLHAKRGR